MLASFEERVDSNVIIPPAIIAPKNANIFTEEIVPKAIVAIPKDCAITAPRVAPALIPMIPGSAREFLKKGIF